MAARLLDVRLEAFDDPVGRLASDDHGAMAFAYAPEHLARADALPLSLSLPLVEAPFGDVAVRAWFDNLLQENDQLTQVMAREGIDRSDIAGLLWHLGGDCPGAVSCLPAGSQAIKRPGRLDRDYDEIDEATLNDLVRRLRDREPLPDVARDPSPLAGVRRKLAVVFDDRHFYLPKPGSHAPTTHILKVPPRYASSEARFEAAATKLAQEVFLDPTLADAAPDVGGAFLLDIDGIPSLLIPRFDRRFTAEGEIFRLHQEDFAQALGLPAGLKYERDGTPGRRFDAAAIAGLLRRTREPAVAIRQFLVATVFDLAIGNTDNHAKNHALLWDAGRTPRFAPLYDIGPTLLDPNVVHDLSFAIGGATTPAAVRADDVAAFLATFGLRPAAQRRFRHDVIAPLLRAIDEATADLTARGMKDFDDLIGREAGRLVETLDLAVDLRPRDLFVERAGGWGGLS
jgi:serine/threonine-protein kinase HipA